MKDEAPLFEELQPLLDKALQGSLAALNHLMAFCFSKLKVQAQRQIGRALRSQVAPSDLAQSTCMQAAQHIHDFRGETAQKFWNWLRRIQRNQLVDMTRKFKLKEAPLDGDSSATNQPLIDALPSPKTWAIKEEQKEAVRKAVDALPAH